jgi:hypothetical protein
MDQEDEVVNDLKSELAPEPVIPGSCLRLESPNELSRPRIIDAETEGSLLQRFKMS